MRKIPLSIVLLITLLAAALVANEVFTESWRGDVLGAISNSSKKDLGMERQEKEKEERAGAFAELKKYPYYKPIQLSFQKIKLNIEQVGLRSDGELGTPSSWGKAGWYTGSVKPGESGTVIIDGHYDTDDRKPAAFWPLKTMKIGDTVSIKDELGRDFSYKVVDIFFVDIQDPQRKQVFEGSDKAELILITCSGVWNEKEGTYDKRLVVKAQLI